MAQWEDVIPIPGALWIKLAKKEVKKIRRACETGDSGGRYPDV